MTEEIIYLDNNATTPTDPRVLTEMLPYFTQKFGNAASKHHAFGWMAEDAVEQARSKVAELIGAEDEEIIFTSGATESNNLALKGVFEAYKSKGNHVITLATEHKCVLDTCKALEKQGANVSYLPVQANGLVDLQLLKESISESTVLISVMYANNETGVIQPIKEIGEIAQESGIVFHCDATQAVGKIPVNVNADNIHLLSLSAHKLYGPKGIGALYIRRKKPRIRLNPLIVGGGHEKGFRSGTLNVPGIVGLGKACEIAMEVMNDENLRVQLLRNKLEQLLLQTEETRVNAESVPRLPNTCNLTFKGINAGLLMAAMPGLAVSAGSACTSASPEPSHVLSTMGLSKNDVLASLRFSLGRFTNKEDIQKAASICKNAINEQRENSIAWNLFKEKQGQQNQTH